MSSPVSSAQPRYELVNVKPGYVIIEQARHSGAARSYFSADLLVPKEEYREGDEVWCYSTSAQASQFDVRDNVGGTVTGFPELLGLLYWGACDPASDLYRMGEMRTGTASRSTSPSPTKHPRQGEDG